MMHAQSLRLGTVGLLCVLLWALVADVRSQTVGSDEMQSLPAASIKGGKTAQTPGKEQRQILLNSSLIFAVKNGQISQVPGLIKQGADVNATDGDGMTALMHAALLGDREMVDTMLRNEKTDVNAIDNNGMTALMQASWAGHREVVADLLAAGAMLNLKTTSRTIRVTKSGANALIAASIGDNLEVVRLLLDEGAQVNEWDADGETALLHAAKGGDPRLVELLLRNRADPEMKDKYGRTPLMVAAIHNNKDVVRTLLLHGANRKATDKAGLTAARYAGSMGHEAIRDMLTPPQSGWGRWGRWD